MLRIACAKRGWSNNGEKLKLFWKFLAVEPACCGSEIGVTNALSRFSFFYMCTSLLFCEIICVKEGHSCWMEALGALEGDLDSNNSLHYAC